jgi:hypothetical protein
MALIVRAREMGRTPFDSNLVNSALDFWSLASEGTRLGISMAPLAPTANRSPPEFTPQPIAIAAPMTRLLAVEVGRPQRGGRLELISLDRQPRNGTGRLP